MPKRVLQGPVVSTKGEKTVVVRVDRSYLHPLLKKVVRRSKRYHAHDEGNAANLGDVVQIIECAPKSKLKRWELVTPEISAQLEEQAKAQAVIEAKRKADAAAAEA